MESDKYRSGNERYTRCNSKSNASIEWDDELKQYYIQYKKKQKQHIKFWSEDEKSFRSKIIINKKYNFSRATYWQKIWKHQVCGKLISEKLE